MKGKKSRIPPYIFIHFDACSLWPADGKEKRAVRDLLELIRSEKVTYSVAEP